MMVNGFSANQEASAEYVLTNYFATAKRNQVRAAHMDVEFDATLPKLGRTATLLARRLVSPKGEIHYEVQTSTGDSAIKKEVIARYMSAEMEPPSQMPTDAAITPANYKFKSKGIRDRDGRRTFVYEVNPRKKRVGLFKGEIWVDAETGLTVRETGSFVKSPSVFLKNVQFVREFALRDGFSVPASIKTLMTTRFWGPAELSLKFTNFNWDVSLASQSMGTSGKRHPDAESRQGS